MVKIVQKYIADDGTEFDTSDEAKNHEADALPSKLVGLTLEQVRAAILREDTALADAIEKIGGAIAILRRESGEKRRAAKATPADGGAPAAGGDQPQPGDEAPPLPAPHRSRRAAAA